MNQIHRLVTYASLATCGLALLFAAPVSAEVTEAERQFVAQIRAELRAELAPDVLENEEGYLPVPRDVFFREMDLILGEHAGRRPYPNSLTGEAWNAVRIQEMEQGLTAQVRSRWEELYWAWREELER